VQVDGRPAEVFDLQASHTERPYQLVIARALPAGAHAVTVTSLAGENSVDGFIVRRAGSRAGWQMIAMAAILGAAWLSARRRNG
jgi:hypothetical protein